MKHHANKSAASQEHNCHCLLEVSGIFMSRVICIAASLPLQVSEHWGLIEQVEPWNGALETPIHISKHGSDTLRLKADFMLSDSAHIRFQFRSVHL
jgi:hypothetical protein